MAYGDNNSQLRAIAETAPLGAAPGNVGQLYIYRTNDTLTSVVADGYFDGVLNDGLNTGDIIIVSGDEDGTPLGAIYLVTAGGADVTVVPILIDTTV